MFTCTNQIRILKNSIITRVLDHNRDSTGLIVSVCDYCTGTRDYFTAQTAAILKSVKKNLDHRDAKPG